jgi:transposase-like protein
VSVVARQYDVNANLVFMWRRLYGHAPDVSPGRHPDGSDALSAAQARRRPSISAL